MLRFITIATPINAFMRRLRGGTHTLPYVGQMAMVVMGPEQEACVETEDEESCFNLYSMPDAWLGFFSYEKAVPASVMNGDPNELIYVSHATVPQGWVGAVDVMQPAIRELVYGLSEVSLGKEVRPDRPLPKGSDYAITYMDGFDFIRLLDTALQRVTSVPESLEHKHFVAACKRMRIPLNHGKSLLGAHRANLLGGSVGRTRVWASGAAMVGTVGGSEFAVRSSE